MCKTHIYYNFFMEFGSNFKRLRKLCGLTQKDVARKLQISQSNISDWENNIARPEYENLIKLGVLYSVTLEELLGLPDTFPDSVDH